MSEESKEKTLSELAAVKDKDIDFSDIPELDDEFWKNAKNNRLTETSKACPILLRKNRDGAKEILAFVHPVAGRQLVKGGIEKGETPQQAALRELAEEAGIESATVLSTMDIFNVGPPEQVWYPVLCDAHAIPDQWEHLCHDDGGHIFRFFWHRFEEGTDETWHPIFRQAVDQISRQLQQKKILQSG